MKRVNEHRTSIPRRRERCIKLLDRLFPPEKSGGIHWSHCVVVETIAVEDNELCPLSQITHSRTFKEACEQVGMKNTDDVWRHAGLQPYNFPDPNITWTQPWREIEIMRLNEMMRQLFRDMQALHPKPVKASRASSRAA